jgi:NADPH:quinone reductase-like Zn-dependent oxidoreductase
MNAAVVHAFDAPPRYASFTDPVAGKDEVVVRVAAAGLHHVVKALADGTHYGSGGQPPFIPGVDGVGRLEDGTRVYFGVSRSPFGSFAEQTVTARGLCIPLPDALDDATAAGIANPAMSSWAALMLRAQFAPGESVLILGATGVAGKLAVQIAKRLGARRVVAAGRNSQALEELKRLGADAVISLNQEHDDLIAAFRREIAESAIDIVLDYLWGPPAEAFLAAVSQKGLQQKSRRIRYIQIGSSAGRTIALPAATLRSSQLELLGSGFGAASIEQIIQAVSRFFQDAAHEPFQIDIERAPLTEVERLWNTDERRARLVFQISS